MTETNKKENLAGELERAGTALKAADLLFENGLFSDAVSRLYYSLLHTVRALLFSKGLEPKSHDGASRLFAQHFVREGVFSTEDGQIFSRLMKFREESDYNPSYVFKGDDFVAFRKDAETLTEKIKVYLAKQRYM